jgi:tetratricopeptide (TPR) repeat protein
MIDSLQLAREFRITARQIAPHGGFFPQPARPSLTHGWFWSAFLRRQPDIAIEHFERYRRLSPHDPLLSRCLSGIGTAHFFNRRYEEVVKLLLMSLEELPTYAPTYRFLAASYAHLGRLDEARYCGIPDSATAFGRVSSFRGIPVANPTLAQRGLACQ